MKTHSLQQIVVIATALGLLGSLITAPSCHWVRIRGRNETNRNLGIWRKTDIENWGRWYGHCTSYNVDEDSPLEIDGELKLARASSIIAPIFAAICLGGNLLPNLTETSLGMGMSLGGAIVAFIFQALTLTINFSEACAISPGTFCSVGFSTWAYWVSLCTTFIFLVAAVLAFIHNSNEKHQDKPFSQEGSPPAQAAAAASFDAAPSATVPVVNAYNNEEA